MFLLHRRSFLANAQIWTTEVEWLTKKVLFIVFAAADCERGEKEGSECPKHIWMLFNKKSFALQNRIKLYITKAKYISAITDQCSRKDNTSTVFVQEISIK